MKSLVRTLTVASAVFALGLSVRAEDEDADTFEAETASEEAASEDAGGVAAPAKVREMNVFAILPSCGQIRGTLEVRYPGAEDWVKAEEGKFYPLGSVYRTGEGSTATVRFGREVAVKLSPDSSFATRMQPLTAPKETATRAISLQGGTIDFESPRNMKSGLFTISAPGFSVNDPAGESRYVYDVGVDGDVATVRCVTGMLKIEGRHFRIKEMHAANEVKIRTSSDQLVTALYGLSGDYMVELDQGSVWEKKFDEGGTEKKESVTKTLDWKLSPKTAVRIHRALPAIGSRMSVSVMTFGADGKLKNRRAFAEQLADVNSGEIGPVDKHARDAAMKKAAEATEGAASEESAEGEAEETSDSGESASESKSDDSGSSSSSDDELDF